MKTILVTTLAAVLAGAAVAQPPPDSARENLTPSASERETMREKARNFWIKSKGYLSEDQTTYTQGAQQTLSDLGKEIDEVAAKAGSTPPAFFKTRLQSLREQHSELSSKLPELSAEAIKTRTSGPRYAFDQTLDSLEAAIDQAENDADKLAKINNPDKQSK